jgi:hypothetical protein
LFDLKELSNIGNIKLDWLQIMSLSTAAKPRHFFAWSAILMALIIVLSIPVTYFIPIATASKQFQMLHHVHGLAFFHGSGFTSGKLNLLPQVR